MKYSVWLKEWVNVYKKPYIKSWKKIKDIIRIHIPEYIKNFEKSVEKIFICGIMLLYDK